MAEATGSRRLVYARVEDLDQWKCRPLGDVDVLDLKDRRVGRLDGIVFDASAEKPLYFAIRRATRSAWFLVPIDDAWYDETQHAIRVDPSTRGEAMRFDPDEFSRMTPADVATYEQRLLAHVGVRSVACPTWLLGE